MRSSSFNIFIYTVFLGFIFQLSHGFEVIQPQNRTVSPDGLASISCEHTAYGKSVQDVRLNLLPSSRNSKKTILCQKGKNECKNIFMHMENSTKYLFILFNTGPEAMDVLYECEVTVGDGDVHHTEKGRPTKLLPGNNSCTSSHQPPINPSSPHWSDLLMWILIGLLGLMLLSICVILFFYIRLRNKNKAHENSTYVEMRKAPV
ncbi:uncharacterized protein LOC113123649 isoform X2 [Mastacembelus armatus]|uniref:uncharacterized protein LOC113123649 isoform X2 n=1 Tax=Mastacembelus armatus TaxID=205130 RepID=UPI000E46162D|nr:uncharacterized protein LOC113123649 isoform X2 [Mastacembelus armatus]